MKEARAPGLRDALGAEQLGELLSAEAASAATLDVAASTPAAIVYTSGTTGFPKGATLSHGNVSRCGGEREYLGILPDDRLLLFLPLFHCFGQNAVMNAGLHAGASLILHRGFDVERVMASWNAMA